MLIRAIFFSLLVLVPGSASADAPAVRQLAATASRGKVSFSFELTEAFRQPQILRAIQSGVPTGFTYDVELIRKRPNWFDKTLSTMRIEIICTYNSLTKEYLVNYRRNRKLVWSEVFTDFPAARQRMTRIDEPEAFATNRHPSKLRVRVRAELIRSYIFYVIPRDVATDWSETRVKSAP